MEKICKPLEEGGLGIRYLIHLNEAYNLKLCWEMESSDTDWAKLLRSRVLKNDRCISYHIFSSLLSSFKSEYNLVIENSAWQTGDGNNVNFWNDL